MTKPLADMTLEELRTERRATQEKIADASAAKAYYEAQAVRIQNQIERVIEDKWASEPSSLETDGIPPEADNHTTGGVTVDTAEAEPEAAGEGWDIAKSTEATTPAEDPETLTTDAPDAPDAQSGDETTDIAARIEAALAGDGDEAGAALEPHRWPFGVRQEADA